MKQPKMILFDYGGTLMYEPDFCPEAGNKAIYPYIIENPHNISLTEFSEYLLHLFDEIRALRGELIEIHEHFFLRYVLEHFEMKLSVSLEEAEQILFNHVVHVQKTPGSMEMLADLQNRGIRTGVISNLCWSGEALTKRLYENFPDHHFDFIMTSSDYIFRKPERHIFDLAVRKSGLSAEEIWYCGNDIEIDIFGAYHAGLFPVFYDDRSVPGKFHEKNDKYKLEFPHLRLKNWKELKEYLN